MYHNAFPKPEKRTPKKPTPLRRSAIKKVYKSTGEAVVHNMIALERPALCQVCEKRIDKLQPHNFAHILGKGAFPRFRLRKDNIWIMCYNLQGTGCHSLYDTEAESVLMKQNPERWAKVFKLKQELKEQYNKRQL